MPKQLSTFQMQKVLGLKRECFREWMKAGFINPTVPAKGAGTKAVFAGDDIYRAAIFAALHRGGFRRERAAEIAKATDLNCSVFYFRQSNDLSTAINVEEIKRSVERSISG